MTQHAVDTPQFFLTAPAQWLDPRRRFTLSPEEIAFCDETGDLLEVELTIQSKNDYEYVILEDVKAAGCESGDRTSGP